jgi:hypothetical protein
MELKPRLGEGEGESKTVVNGVEAEVGVRVSVLSKTIVDGVEAEVGVRVRVKARPLSMELKPRLVLG